ncbi:DNA polymerase A [Carpediemonas membranifera]|uniref:DNA-directed DNA polymerase n=1 Tax=Carpediemonas membranifera TaxID=201153 RepID=A0A8J6C1J6_9EUKA|nr:DNA polymerase A [Carpediemonas membranifera]|eukprot:KAG9397656.1 DNA polymerase A [Carpediemonas membranifera]
MSSAYQAWTVYDRRTNKNSTAEQRMSMQNRLNAATYDARAFLTSYFEPRSRQHTTPVVEEAPATFPPISTAVLPDGLLVLDLSTSKPGKRKAQALAAPSATPLCLTSSGSFAVDTIVPLLTRAVIVPDTQAVLAEYSIATTPRRWVDPLLAHWMLNPDEGDISINQLISTGSYEDYTNLWATLSKCLVDYGLQRRFLSIEMRLAAVCADLSRPIHLSQGALNAHNVALTAQMNQSIEDFKMSHPAAIHVNVASPQQVSALLYGTMGLPRPQGVGRTNTGTDIKSLSTLAEHPIVGHIISYRKAAKLLSTYVTPFIGVDSVATVWGQTHTGTGRMQCRGGYPLLQTPAGIRNCIVPDPNSGKVWVGADYCQIECVVAAHMSADTELSEMLGASDVHRAVAARVFSVPEGVVTDVQRAIAKRAVYASIYGMSAESLAESLAQSGVSVADCHSAVVKISEIFSGLARWKAELERLPTVQTLFGRPRHISSRHATRAVNSVVQGTAGDLLRMSAVRVHEKLRQTASGRLVMLLHDEIIVECSEAEVVSVAAILRQAMTEGFPIDRLRVSCKLYRRSWGEMEEINM